MLENIDSNIDSNFEDSIFLFQEYGMFQSSGDQKLIKKDNLSVFFNFHVAASTFPPTAMDTNMYATLLFYMNHHYAISRKSNAPSS